MDLINLKFVKLSPNIKTPTKSNEFAVELDIYSPTDCERLKSHNRVSTEPEADWQSWQAVSSSTGYK